MVILPGSSKDSSCCIESKQCSRLLLVGVLGPIINTSVFQKLAVRNDSSSTFLYIDYAFHKFLNFVFHWAAKKYKAEYNQHNS